MYDNQFKSQIRMTPTAKPKQRPVFSHDHLLNKTIPVAQYKPYVPPLPRSVYRELVEKEIKADV